MQKINKCRLQECTDKFLETSRFIRCWTRRENRAYTLTVGVNKMSCNRSRFVRKKSK